MAIYHCSIKSISRGAGQSIVAAAAYRHACKLEDDRTGELHDYSRKRGLEHSSIYLPSGVNASWIQDRERLWNAAEAAEKRKDARLGREIVLALPSELSREQRQELAGEIARHLAERYGLAVDVAIHQPNREGDQRNYHAHMLMSSRRITPEGFGEKARELDDREHGPAEVEYIRGEWARLANRALESARQHVQIDHRSFQKQGLKRMPTLHLGPSANAMERRGILTRLGDRNREAQAINARAATLEFEQRQVQEKAREAEKQPELPSKRVEAVSQGMGQAREKEPATGQPRAEKPLNQLEGAELLPLIERRRAEQIAAARTLQSAKENLERKDRELFHCKREIQEHNDAYNSTGFFKKMLKTGEINKKAEELEKRFKLCAQNVSSAKAAVEKAQKDITKTNTALESILDEYAKTPHAKAVAKEKREAIERQAQKRKERALEREHQRRSKGFGLGR